MVCGCCGMWHVVSCFGMLWHAVACFVMPHTVCFVLRHDVWVQCKGRYARDGLKKGWHGFKHAKDMMSKAKEWAHEAAVLYKRLGHKNLPHAGDDGDDTMRVES